MEKHCQFCNGSGQCALCSGNGSYREDGNYIECADCLSEGKCAKCRGTGEGQGLFRELWNSYSELGYYGRRCAEALVVFVGVMSVIFWRVMLPFLGFVVAVALYLRSSRPKDSR